jgi:hypothetical protein
VVVVGAGVKARPVEKEAGVAVVEVAVAKADGTAVMRYSPAPPSRFAWSTAAQLIPNGAVPSKTVPQSVVIIGVPVKFGCVRAHNVHPPSLEVMSQKADTVG